MREKPIKKITPEERKRGWEHTQRVLKMIKSQYRGDLRHLSIEVSRFRSFNKRFLERVLSSNEVRAPRSKAQNNFWNIHCFCRNRYLPRNFSNQRELYGLDISFYSLERLDLAKVRVTDSYSQMVFKPDLEKDAYVYGGEIFFTTNILGAEVDSCSDCEWWNRQILDEESEYFGRGLVLKLVGAAIGYVKLKGERSFLCSRTVRDKDGKLLFVKGIVYSIDPNMEAFVKEKLEVQKNWQSVNLEDVQKDWFGDVDGRDKLRFRHMRFIKSEEIFKKLDEFNEKFDR